MSVEATVETPLSEPPAPPLDRRPSRRPASCDGNALHANRLERLHGVPVQAQLLGHVSDRRGPTARPHVEGEPVTVERIVARKSSRSSSAASFHPLTSAKSPISHSRTSRSSLALAPKHSFHKRSVRSLAGLKVGRQRAHRSPRSSGGHRRPLVVYVGDPVGAVMAFIRPRNSGHGRRPEVTSIGTAGAGVDNGE